MAQEDIITDMFGDSNGFPSILHQGIYYVRTKVPGKDDQKDPVYIVEYLEKPNGYQADMVTVYEAVKDKHSNIRKSFYVDKQVHGYKGVTKLGKFANKLYPSTEKVKEITNRPLYVSQVGWGTDSFSGVEGRGFLDREPQKQRLNTKTGEIEHYGGKTSGVFITFDSIEWEHQYVATRDIIDEERNNRYLFLG